MLEEIERRVTGTSSGIAQRIGQLDPRFTELTERLFGRALTPRCLSAMRHAAVTLCLDALVTQLESTRLDARISIAAQVLSEQQIIAILQLTSVAGLHSVSTGAPALAEEARARFGAVELTAEQERVRHAFENEGPRPRPMDAMYRSILERDPEYFEAFRAWIDHPWRSGALDHGTLHLVCIALDIACTHLYESGFRRHVREALDLGVSADEIFEVIEIASVEGLRSVFAAGAAWVSA